MRYCIGERERERERERECVSVCECECECVCFLYHTTNSDVYETFRTVLDCPTLKEIMVS